MAIPSLHPGFCFHPTDVELVGKYLKRKLMGKPLTIDVIAEVEVYKFAPWDLPVKSMLCNEELEWYFFCPRNRKHHNSTRTKQATDIGYWKSTGKDTSIIFSSRSIGNKKTLIFHLGKAPEGYKTNWVMHEYRMEDSQLFDAGYSQDAYVLCKIIQKSGLGPKVGEQYVAPFNESECEDDNAEDAISLPHFSCSSFPVSYGLMVSSNSFQESLATPGSVDVSLNPDLHDDDGFWLEELADLVKASPTEENGMKRMSTSEVLCKTVDGLEDFSPMKMRNMSYSEDMTIEYGPAPEPFIELNDFLDLGEDLLKLIDPFDQHSPIWDSNCDCLDNEHGLLCLNDATSTASTDCFPPSNR